MRLGQKTCNASWQRFGSRVPAIYADKKAGIAYCPDCCKPVRLFKARNQRFTDTIPSHKAWTDYDRSAALACPARVTKLIAALARCKGEA